MPTLDLLAALESAGADELTDVDAQIATAEKQLDALRAVRKILDCKVNGKPQRVPAGEGKGAASKKYRLAAAKHLLHSGPIGVVALAHQCDIPRGSTTLVLNHPWFERTAKGDVGLTQEGRQAVA